VLCVGCNMKWGALLCGNINHHFVQQYITIPNSWDFFAPLMLENRYYKHRLMGKETSEASKDVTAVATEAAVSHLLQPHAELQNVINDYAEKFKGRFVVGIHVRRKGMNYIGLSGDELILHDYRTCAEYVAQENNVDNLPVYFYISTDSPEVFNVIGKTFPTDRILQSPYPHFHGREKGIQDAIVDMWLLGETDEVIQSDGSTFSQFVAARKRHVIYSMGLDGQCFRTVGRRFKVFSHSTPFKVDGQCFSDMGNPMSL